MNNWNRRCQSCRYWGILVFLVLWTPVMWNCPLGCRWHMCWKSNPVHNHRGTWLLATARDQMLTCFSCCQVVVWRGSKEREMRKMTAWGESECGQQLLIRNTWLASRMALKLDELQPAKWGWLIMPPVMWKKRCFWKGVPCPWSDLLWCLAQLGGFPDATRKCSRWQSEAEAHKKFHL